MDICTTTMPRKYVRKPRRRFRKYIRKGKKSTHIAAKRETLTYMVKNMPIAPKYRTKMSCDWLAQIVAGKLPYTTGQNAYVGLNYLYHPVSNNSWFPVTGYGPFTITSSIGASSIMPAGFSQICPSNGQLYRDYRVYASRITVSAIPTVITDAFQMTLTPSESTTTPGEVSVAMSQPYTTSKTFFSGKENGTKGDVLTNYISVHKFNGVTQSAIQNDLSGSFTGGFNATYPGLLNEWVINVQPLSGAANTGPILFRFRLDYWVEFFSPTSGGLFVT